MVEVSKETHAERPAVLDIDQHIFETRSTWADHIEPKHRPDALAIEDDRSGWPWLTWRGQRLYPIEVQQPGRPGDIGQGRLAMAEGKPAPGRYEDLLPPEYAEASRRLDALERLGVEACVLFPNFGLLYEDLLKDDVGALCANLSAYNRWLAGQLEDGRGRLFGVAHLTLRDPSWALHEVETLAAAGIRLAMVAPSPVDGRPLSDEGLFPVWVAMSEHQVAPVFHVGNFQRSLEAAWYAGDPEPADRLLDSVVLWLAPAVALTDLITHGILERLPGLRLGVVELTAGWVPRFLLQLDGAWDFYAARHGGPLQALPLRPSEYFLRQVKVAALPYEMPEHLIEMVGPDTFMFGSDWPHAEGVEDPGGVARALALPEGPAAERFLAGNAEWLLGLR
jgi:predicted TIM-barrel fold metal-dependent hydrolase